MLSWIEMELLIWIILIWNCKCCKPETGLILQAIEKYPDIDLSNSFMCGDSVSDLKCAEAVGLQFYGIHFGEHEIKDLSCFSILKL